MSVVTSHAGSWWFGRCDRAKSTPLNAVRALESKVLRLPGSRKIPMSSVGRIIFASSLLGTGAIVYLVHSSQMAERARMYDGVLRDVERQERKKQQRSQQPS